MSSTQLLTYLLLADTAHRDVLGNGDCVFAYVLDYRKIYSMIMIWRTRRRNVKMRNANNKHDKVSEIHRHRQTDRQTDMTKSVKYTDTYRQTRQIDR